MAAPSIASIVAALAGIGGVLGAAVSSGASTLTSAIGGAASAIGGALGALGSILSAGVSVIGGAISALLGPLASIGGAITSALSGAISAFTGALGSLISGIGDAIGTTIKAGAAIIGGALAAAGGVAYGFVKVLSTLTDEVQRTAKQIASIRNNTGMDLGRAQAGYNSLRGAGLSGEDATAFLGSNAMRGNIGRQIAGAYNLPDPTDPRFAVEAARKFQSQNIFQGRAMADTLSGGNASAGLLQLLNTRPETIQEGQRFQTETNAKLGVTPEAIRKLADELPVLQNKISIFVDAVKTRFVVSMLPAIEEGLNRLTNYLEANSENIASAIQKGVVWLYADFPQLLLDGASIGIAAMEALANGFLGLGDSVAQGLHAIGTGQSGIFKFLESMAGATDSFIEILARAVASFAALGATLESALATTPVGKFIANKLGLNPQVRDPRKVYSDTLAMMPKLNSSGALAAFKKSGVADQWGDNVQAFTDNARGHFASVDDTLKNARDAAQTSLGTPENRRQTIEQLLQQLIDKTGDKDTVAELRALRDQVRANTGTDVIGGLKSAIATDAYRQGF